MTHRTNHDNAILFQCLSQHALHYFCSDHDHDEVQTQTQTQTQARIQYRRDSAAKLDRALRQRRRLSFHKPEQFLYSAPKNGGATPGGTNWMESLNDAAALMDAQHNW